MEEQRRIPDRKNGINNKPNHARNKRFRNASRVVGPYEADYCDTDSRQEQQHQLFAFTRPRHSVAARSEGALNVAHGILAKPSRCARIYHELSQVAGKSRTRTSAPHGPETGFPEITLGELSSVVSLYSDWTSGSFRRTSRIISACAVSRGGSGRQFYRSPNHSPTRAISLGQLLLHIVYQASLSPQYS
jgi:hypothetical protein